MALEAGRIMLKRIDELLNGEVNFAFETTLATKSYSHKILTAKENGFKVILLYFWLNKLELAIERVNIRVKEGGHNIESDVIKRRYFNGVKNLFEIYLELGDEIMIFDNSENKYELLAEKVFNNDLLIKNTTKFNQLYSYYEKTI
jgi:predicted ABC-type ATPase